MTLKKNPKHCLAEQQTVRHVSSIKQERVIGKCRKLTFENTHSKMFGRHNCRALGKHIYYSFLILFAGKAEPAVIKSDSKGSEGSRFHLEWTADSFSPINKFKVEFKEISEDVWTVSTLTKISMFFICGFTQSILTRDSTYNPYFAKPCLRDKTWLTKYLHFI